MMLSYRPLLEPTGHPINATNLVPGLLRDFGDMSDVLRLITPRKVLVAAPRYSDADAPPGVAISRARFSQAPEILTQWLTV